MSNKLAVKAHLERMKDQGFRTLSFLVHKDDEQKVRTYVQKLKSERLRATVITPKDTLGRMKRLSLTKEQFSKIHHFGEKATTLAHEKYLMGLARGYQLNRNNYVVAKRLAAIEALMEDGAGLGQAMEKAAEDNPFFNR